MQCLGEHNGRESPEMAHLRMQRPQLRQFHRFVAGSRLAVPSPHGKTAQLGKRRRKERDGKSDGSISAIFKLPLLIWHRQENR